VLLHLLQIGGGRLRDGRRDQRGRGEGDEWLQHARAPVSRRLNTL
jgi:hypothetical protein